MKTKSKFRRAIIRNEIDKKLATHSIAVLYKMQPADKSNKVEEITAVK